MAKDPAFLFYTNDFSTGTQFLTDEQLGKYLRLLMAQHQHGHLTEKQVMFICKSYDKDILIKFKKDDNDMFFNERLELEIARRKHYTESRSNNKSGRKKALKPILNNNSIKNENKSYDLSYDNHMEDVNINKDIVSIKEEKVKRSKQKEEELVYPFNSEKFMNVWNAFIEMPKQKKKIHISKQMMLKNLSDFDEDFAIKQIELAIQNNWQGLTFSDTKEKYLQHLNAKKLTHGGKQQTNEQKRSELNALADLACQVVSAIDSQNR